jgi:hypothetical protein
MMKDTEALDIYVPKAVPPAQPMSARAWSGLASGQR